MVHIVSLRRDHCQQLRVIMGMMAWGSYLCSLPYVKAGPETQEFKLDFSHTGGFGSFKSSHKFREPCSIMLGHYYLKSPWRS